MPGRGTAARRTAAAATNDGSGGASVGPWHTAERTQKEKVAEKAPVLLSLQPFSG